MGNRRWIVEEILEESSASGTGQLFNVDGYGLMTPVRIIEELTKDDDERGEGEKRLCGM